MKNAIGKVFGSWPGLRLPSFWLPVAFQVSLFLASPLSTTAEGTIRLDTTPSLVGSPSCSASTCHGNVIGQGPTWNHAMSIWLARDPHSGAGRLLRRENALSASVVGMLDPAAAKSDQAYENVLQSRCISCHATVSPSQCEPKRTLDPLVLDAGVSCESCHGHAASWLEPHIGKAWRLEDQSSSAKGMADTRSIVGRAGTCVRCHVGSRREDGLVRDVNHDLIAAGHPALRFDLLIFDENMPQHWSDQREHQDAFLASAVRVREVGRAINLRAAASLSAQRADDHLRGSGVPWPELADYDCFACHQSLSIRRFETDSLDRPRSDLRISDGLPIWNAWHTVGQHDLRNNRRALVALSPQLNDPLQLASIAKVLASQSFNRARTRAEAIPEDPLTVLKQLQRQVLTQPLDGWHDAAFIYLQLDAVARDLRRHNEVDPIAIRLTDELVDLEKLLRFQSGKPSTAASSSSRLMLSPANFDRDLFVDRMKKLAVLSIPPLPEDQHEP